MRYFAIFWFMLFLAGCESDRRADSPYRWVHRYPTEKEGIALTISVDADSITADRILHARIELTSPQDVRAVLPDAEAVPLDGLILRRWSAQPAGTDDEGRDVQNILLTLEPTIPGKSTIGPVEFRYERLENGNWVGHAITSEVAVVTVLSLGVPEEGEFEFKGPRGAAWPRDNRMYYYIAGGFLLIGIFIFVYILTMHRKRRPGPVIPPHRAALRALVELENRELVRKAAFKEYYSELSDIMRRYIEKSLGIAALEQTTREIMCDIMRHDTIERGISNTLRELLEESDMVKFAKFRPSRESAEERIHQGRVFIRSTAPSEDQSG